MLHELLERSDLRRPVPPSAEQVAAAVAARGATATRAEVERLGGLVAGFLDSPLCERMARATSVRRELPFAFALATGGEAGHPPLIEGAIDAFCREGAQALVVDYKSDRLSAEADLEKLCEQTYSTQRLVYALAALRDGVTRVEVAHAFLERPGEPVLVAYEISDLPSLEARLGALAADLLEARHEPSERPCDEALRRLPRASLALPLDARGDLDPTARAVSPARPRACLLSVRRAAYCPLRSHDPANHPETKTGCLSAS